VLPSIAFGFVYVHPRYERRYGRIHRFLITTPCSATARCPKAASSCPYGYHEHPASSYGRRPHAGGFSRLLMRRYAEARFGTLINLYRRREIEPFSTTMWFSTTLGVT
jgi:hypothetical protein